MAEGLLRHLSRGQVESFSAGDEPLGLHPMAVSTMAEVGIDISSQSSKHLKRFLHEDFDYVITVCDRVKDTCPTWPGAKEHIHWSFEDLRRSAIRTKRDESSSRSGTDSHTASVSSYFRTGSTLDRRNRYDDTHRNQRIWPHGPARPEGRVGLA
jgi:arsenate reductase